ncbi:MAG: hypothetical protein GY761_22110 [Hyphomicrobiales bacterium]|nr:hypothetical protein [Hyphomicrobiales bacterium]
MNQDDVSLKILSDKSISVLEDSLKEYGMNILGGFHLEPDEAVSFARSNCTVAGLVVASHGRDMWRSFQASVFFKDQLPDSLDRWTRSVLEDLAIKTGSGLVLPFDRPFPPFQEWAKRASGISNSPLGILMHHEYGLWFGLRGVFLFEVKVENQAVNKLIQHRFDNEYPCDICIEKPCLSHCPVNAFDKTGLNVKACFSHLEKIVNFSSQPDCLSKGCAARDACPVGAHHKYCDEQLQFHMNSYYSGNA